MNSPETITLWSWSPTWAVCLAVIFLSACYCLLWSSRSIYLLLMKKGVGGGDLRLSAARKAVLAFPNVIVALAGGACLFWLLQQSLFRFSRITYDVSTVSFHSPLGIELHSCTTDIVVGRVQYFQDGKRTGYLHIQTRSGTTIRSIRSEDTLTMERIERLFRKK